SGITLPGISVTVSPSYNITTNLSGCTYVRGARLQESVLVTSCTGKTRSAAVMTVLKSSLQFSGFVCSATQAERCGPKKDVRLLQAVFFLSFLSVLFSFSALKISIQYFSPSRTSLSVKIFSCV